MILWDSIHADLVYFALCNRVVRVFWLYFVQKQNPCILYRNTGVCGIKSLTMTYFHTGCSTIIGAKLFHGPVRDGKGWYQLAMVIRHDLLIRCFHVRLWRTTNPIKKKRRRVGTSAHALPSIMAVKIIGCDCTNLHLAYTYVVLVVAPFSKGL